jgi:hypothetical protein
VTEEAGAKRFDRSRDNRRLMRVAGRLAFIEGAEEDSRRRLNRPLTAEELRRVLRHFPGG